MPSDPSEKENKKVMQKTKKKKNRTFSEKYLFSVLRPYLGLAKWASKFRCFTAREPVTGIHREGFDMETMLLQR